MESSEHNWANISETICPEMLVLSSLYMFHRIIFLLLIFSTLSCNFNRCADCFQSFSKQRFPEYSKCRALNRFKIKNKHNKFFIMLERNSVYEIKKQFIIRGVRVSDLSSQQVVPSIISLSSNSLLVSSPGSFDPQI